jgi:hypothetical protein
MNKGNRIKIINYGSIIWYKRTELFNENTIPDSMKVLEIRPDGVLIIDISPELIGKIGTIDTIAETQGIKRYAINLDTPGKHAWYNENQLELINEQGINV